VPIVRFGHRERFDRILVSCRRKRQNHSSSSSSRWYSSGRRRCCSSFTSSSFSSATVSRGTLERIQRRNKRNASSSQRRRTRRGHRSFPRPHRCRLNRRRSHQERRHHRSHVHIRETIVSGKMKHFSRRKSCVFIPSYYHITRDVAFTLFREYVLLHRTEYCSLCCCWWWSTENDSDVDAFPSLFSKTSTWFSNALVAHERHVFRRKRRRTEEETSGIERKTDRILSRNLPRRRWVFQRPRERRYPQREGSFGNVWCGGKGGGKGLDAKPLERTMEINLHDRVRRDRITRFFGTTTTVAVFSTAANRGWRHLSRV